MRVTTLGALMLTWLLVLGSGCNVERVPDPPTDMHAVADNASAIVSWRPPANAGSSPITEYIITPSPEGVSVRVEAARTSARVLELVNGNRYSFTVKAVNEAGESLPSQPSEDVTPSAPRPPGPPTNVVAAARDAAAHVEWQPPAFAGSKPILRYVVTASPAAAGAVEVDASVTDLVYAGLTNGVEYTFSVVAYNEAGAGVPSARSNPVRPRMLSAPVSPTNVVATAGDRQVSLTWEVPADDGGAPIQQYIVVSSPSAPSANISVVGTRAQVTGLLNGTNYTFTVAARSSVGLSEPSAPSNAVMPAARPGAPRMVTAKAGPGQARVSWSPPIDNGGASITQYTVRTVPESISVTVAGNQSFAVIAGLSIGAGQRYAFTVSATNVAGTGPASVPSPEVVPLVTCTGPDFPDRVLMASWYIEDMVAADFDGDGRKDVAVQTAGSVVYFINQGDGRFSDSLFPGVSARVLASADLNRDGLADLVVAGDGLNTVGVLLSKGASGFSKRVDYSTLENNLEVAVADFNGDGRADIAVPNFQSNSVSVLMGNGDGTLASRVTYAVGDGPVEVLGADFNRDGRADLVVLNRRASTLSVMLNTGGATFGSRLDLTTPSFPEQVAVGDFSGDGNLDLAVSSSGSSTEYLGNGNGTFGTGQTLTISPVNPRTLIAADGNGDGRADVIATDSESGFVYILTHMGYGLLPVSRSATVTHPDALAAADFTGDGVLDLLVGGDSLVLKQGRALGLDGRIPQPVAAGASTLLSTDFNQDGRLDLIALHPSSNAVNVLSGNADGTFGSASAPEGLRFLAGAGPQFISIADMNDDGLSDLLVSNETDSTVSVMLNSVGGTAVSKADYVVGARPAGVAAADFNRDGMMDLAVANHDANTVSILIGRAGGMFAPKRDYAAGIGPHQVVSADFDLDGYVDLAVSNSGASGLRILRNDGTGSFPSNSELSAPYSTDGLWVEDFNRDGWWDLATVTEDLSSGAGNLSIYQGRVGGGFNAATPYFGTPYDFSLVTDDFDGDGDVDIAMYDTYASMAVRLLLNRGDGIFVNGPSFDGGPGIRAMTAGDFNRDGRVDLAITNTDEKTVSILLNRCR